MNGDDTVISASREVTVQDYPEGYRLNDDKTIRASNVVEVNSTAFLLTRGGWRVVRHLRRGGAPVDYPGMLHMAQAVLVSRGFTDAYQRARIGRRWGFLPSQLGHMTYPAFLRERGMSRRSFTYLPEISSKNDSRLMAMSGSPSSIEAEALRSFFWEYGREGGKKRDVYSPSCGYVRRTYAYRVMPVVYRLSFVGWVGPKSCVLRGKTLDTYFLPEDWVSEEEERGLQELDHWRLAFDSLALEEKSSV